MEHGRRFPRKAYCWKIAFYPLLIRAGDVLRETHLLEAAPFFPCESRQRTQIQQASTPRSSGSPRAPEPGLIFSRIPETNRAGENAFQPVPIGFNHDRSRKPP